MNDVISNNELSDWQVAGLRYYGYGFFLKKKFGDRVQKVSIDGGFTCPNVDGTVAIGGCTFCDNRSFSPSRRIPKTAIGDQIDVGIENLKRRYRCEKFIAYFQPATNTYGAIDRLRSLYFEALSDPRIVGMAIGTRTDCVPDEVLDLLEEVAGRTYLSVEYGMQTVHNRSLEWMNRGHDHEATVDAIERSRNRGFEVCVHIMLGLPGESYEDMMATAEEVARLKVDAVKIHNLYAVKKTPLGDQVERGEIELLQRDEYIPTLVDFLERIPTTNVVERISGEAPPEYLVGPDWCLDKSAIRLALDAEFLKRDSFQGKRWQLGYVAASCPGS